ncbi:glyoxalase [Aurantibacter sp.]|uniref:glyoxalase n=1 Tax=Aurantibacter sp. TaxID=2807103 RepID=UPI003267A8C4
MINYKTKSIRSFIGAKNYATSKAFYCALGFKEVVISQNMCLFVINEDLSFYLQDAYVKDWINNSMLFLEVEDVEKCKSDLLARKLIEKFPAVRFSEIKNEVWGKELFMHYPSGVLWHFGQFYSK